MNIAVLDALAPPVVSRGGSPLVPIVIGVVVVAVIAGIVVLIRRNRKK